MEFGSYLLLEPGMRVRSRNGDALGTLSEVVADEQADIFRGITVSHGFASHDVFIHANHVVGVGGDEVTVEGNNLEEASASDLSAAESR